MSDNPLALGDCGAVPDSGRRFPFLIAEDGITVELNGTGFPVLVTLSAIFLVDNLMIASTR